MEMTDSRPWTYKALGIAFNRTPKTISDWARNWVPHLIESEIVSGETILTEDSAQVLAAISDLRNQGHKLPYIVEQVNNGLRGELPTFDGAEIQAIEKGHVEKKLQAQVNQLKDELARANALAKMADEYKERSIEAEALLRAKEDELQRVAQERDGLRKEAADAYERGFDKGLERGFSLNRPDQ